LQRYRPLTLIGKALPAMVIEANGSNQGEANGSNQAAEFG
jgi:hypothetical protein